MTDKITFIYRLDGELIGLVDKMIDGLEEEFGQLNRLELRLYFEQIFLTTVYMNVLTKNSTKDIEMEKVKEDFRCRFLRSQRLEKGY